MTSKPREVEFGARSIGDGHSCFITLEAGPTHNGLQSALSLVDVAKTSGADAVKFQVLDPDYLVADRSMLFNYTVLVDAASGETKEISEPLFDILSRRTLERSEWRTLKSYCDEVGLTFFATALKEDEIDFLAEIGCESLKIASGDVNHLPLLRHAAQTGMCLQLDTGNSTLGEIENAVDVIVAEGNERIIIHHCPSGYPARLQGINLRVIKTLRRMFSFPVAFSDHSPGWDMDVAAVALGAQMVEKTITHDRTTPSVEHIFSLEPDDASKFVHAIRDLEIALGEKRRRMSASELLNRNGARRSVFLKHAVSVGDQLTMETIEFRRPGGGIAPDQIAPLLNASFSRALPAGHKLSLSDIKWS